MTAYAAAIYNAISGSMRGLPRNVRYARHAGDRAIAYSVLVGGLLLLPLIALVTAAQLGYYWRGRDRRAYHDQRTVALVRGLSTPTWHASSWITRRPGDGDGHEIGRQVLDDADQADAEVRIQAANEHIGRTLYEPLGFEFIDHGRRPRMRRPRRSERENGGA